ncbi:MAG: hypothetical protein NC191_08455 [Muribaculaceae bacterium]|nr:hypothetical protein [Muribaculaceae bacterium]
MIVNNVQQNHLQQRIPYRKAGATPQFTGAEKLVDVVRHSLKAEKTLARMKDLEWLKGEIGGILITALGTGLVAPIFIGTNPFVKAPKGASADEKQEVKNTKWYTAMRQPISAALAIMFQVSALKPIDKFLDKKFNVAENSKYVDFHLDQSLINNKSYRQSLVNKEFKQQGIKKPSIFRIFTDGYRKTMDARKAFNTQYKARVDEIGNQQVDNVAKEFQRTGRIEIPTRAAGERYLDNKTMAELINGRIDDYIEDAEKLKLSKKALADYVHRAEILVNNSDTLKKMFKDAPKDEAGIEVFIKDLLKKDQPEDIKTILQEILDRPADIRGNRISRTLQRINTINDACDGTFTVPKYLEAMLKRNTVLDRMIAQLTLTKIEKPERATTELVSTSLKRLIETCHFEKTNELLNSILHNTITFDSNMEGLSAKIHKDITKAYKKLIENEYKAFNQASKVAIGVGITLPFTCTVLNWVYPRFMEIFFPKLAGVKKDNAEKAAAQTKVEEPAKVDGGDK